jgi:hypothetical protein
MFMARLKNVLFVAPILLAVACERGKDDAVPPVASVTAAAVPSVNTPHQPGVISIVAATYGKACGAPVGNATGAITSKCAGQAKCSFLVTNGDKDPFPNCSKDYVVQYRCSKDGQIKEEVHPPVQGENYSIDLDCQ